MNNSNTSLLLLYSGVSLERVATWVKNTSLLMSSWVSLERVAPWVKITLLLMYIGTIVSADVNSSTAIADNLQDGSKGNNDQIIPIYQDVRGQDFGFEPPCPNAEDITPCVCTYNVDFDIIDLDCSQIESEEQLKQVFEAYFPLQKFRKFRMMDNRPLKVLKSNVFGNVSFESIYIVLTDIEVVETDAFNSCYETATNLSFIDNKITSFPFNDISKFPKLSIIDISGNYLEAVPLDFFHGLTNLETILLDHNHATFTGNFQNIPNLKLLNLPGNNLYNIPTNFFKTGSNNFVFVGLSDCQISSVEPDAFDILEDLNINLVYNLLTTLEEATWRPLLEGGVFIRVDLNPLDCGCDVAWLFAEDHLLDQVSERTACSDGQYLNELDPQIFDEC